MLDPSPGSKGLLLLGEEKHNRYSPMKKSSLRAHSVKRIHYERRLARRVNWMRMMYLLIVKIHDPTPTGRNILVTFALPAHCQGGIHMHVMAREVQSDQGLEDDCQSGHG